MKEDQKKFYYWCVETLVKEWVAKDRHPDTENLYELGFSVSNFISRNAAVKYGLGTHNITEDTLKYNMISIIEDYAIKRLFNDMKHNGCTLISDKATEVKKSDRPEIECTISIPFSVRLIIWLFCTAFGILAVYASPDMHWGLILFIGFSIALCLPKRGVKEGVK